MTSRISLGIVGHRGYSGQALASLAMHSQRMDIRTNTGRSDVHTDPSAQEAALRAEARALASCDVVALALPSDAARAWTRALIDAGASRILDLSDAHRLAPEIHYGIPELFGAPSADARVVANPGCYPTATLLALRPLVDAKLVDGAPVAVHGCSGASGAGKGLREDLHFCNLTENPFPYKIGEHRHQPEIERYLARPICFVTQILPIQRGMQVTCFVQTHAPPARLLEVLRERYAGCPWITVLDQPGPRLGMRHAVGTHQCLLAVGPRASAGLVPVFATIDNLMRGAASQAMHNLALWLGLDPADFLPPPPGAPAHDLPPVFGTALQP